MIEAAGPTREPTDDLLTGQGIGTCTNAKVGGGIGQGNHRAVEAVAEVLHRVLGPRRLSTGTKPLKRMGELWLPRMPRPCQGSRTCQSMVSRSMNKRLVWL